MRTDATQGLGLLEQEAELLDAEPGTALDRFRAVIKSARQRLFERYDQGVPVSQLLEARSRVVDMLLRCA